VQIFFLGLSILAVLPITAGGDDGTKTNLTSSQYFYAFPFGDGPTQIAAGPGVSDLAAHVNKCVCQKWKTLALIIQKPLKTYQNGT
jgi:hypothetical protein